MLSTSFSKVFLHFWQVYSNIGIGNVHLQFLLSGVSSRPDRAGGRGDHVKRDMPGILGRTRNHTIRKTMKIITPSILLLYTTVECGRMAGMTLRFPLLTRHRTIFTGHITPRALAVVIHGVIDCETCGSD